MLVLSVGFGQVPLSEWPTIRSERVRVPTHENIEQHFVVIDVSEREPLDPEPDLSELRLQRRIDLWAAHVRKTVFGRECRLSHIHFGAREGPAVGTGPPRWPHSPPPLTRLLDVT
jgi:hypothetical protein